MSSDSFDLGAVSVDDIKNTFGQLINDLQFLPVRQDVWIERAENAKHELIALAARNAEIFDVRRKNKG